MEKDPFYDDFPSQRKQRPINISDFDRIDENPDNCGGPFYGVDDIEHNRTDWYDQDGNLDCSTPIPSDCDDDEYQRRLCEDE